MSSEEIIIYEKTNIYNLENKTLEEFQQFVENNLKLLNFSTKSVKLDDTLFIITFLNENRDKNQQKDNKIAIYLEQNQVYVQVKGLLTNKEIISFWKGLDKNIAGSVEIPKKETAIWNSITELKNLGFLPESNIKNINTMIASLPENRQKQIIERLKEIELEFNELKSQGLVLSENEKKELREKLIKFGKEKRKQKFDEIIKNKKAEEKILAKDDIINMIIKEIKDRGFNIEFSDAQEFVESFQEQFNRLPILKEIDSIAASYIKMKKEEEIITKTEAPAIEKEEFAEEIIDESFLEGSSEILEETKEISPTEALIEIIKELNYLSETEKSYYIKMFDRLNFEEQKKIVKNLELIQENIKEIPDLNEHDKIELRKELILSNEEDIILKFKEMSLALKETEETEETEEELLIWDPKKALQNLKFLTQPNITSILNMIKKLPEERQKQVIERLKKIEKEFDDYEKEGIILSDLDRAQYRMDLVKLTDKNRKEKLFELTRDKREEFISNRLFEEIPQFKFEDNEKLIKELIWLSFDEINQRIKKIKEKINKKLEKKKELFSKSTAGSTCPECGWPVGSFSKKCPRCGHKLIDWL
ncbi:MAG: zinc ribbon domain-containing protein [Promethearchaeota archaeon]